MYLVGNNNDPIHPMCDVLSSYSRKLPGLKHTVKSRSKHVVSTYSIQYQYIVIASCATRKSLV